MNDVVMTIEGKEPTKIDSRLARSGTIWKYNHVFWLKCDDGRWVRLSDGATIGSEHLSFDKGEVVQKGYTVHLKILD